MAHKKKTNKKISLTAKDTPKKYKTPDGKTPRRKSNREKTRSKEGIESAAYLANEIEATEDIVLSGKRIENIPNASDTVILEEVAAADDRAEDNVDLNTTPLANLASTPDIVSTPEALNVADPGAGVYSTPVTKETALRTDVAPGADVAPTLSLDSTAHPDVTDLNIEVDSSSEDTIRKVSNIIAFYSYDESLGFDRSIESESRSTQTENESTLQSHDINRLLTEKENLSALAHTLSGDKGRLEAQLMSKVGKIKALESRIVDLCNSNNFRSRVVELETIIERMETEGKEAADQYNTQLKNTETELEQYQEQYNNEINVFKQNNDLKLEEMARELQTKNEKIATMTSSLTHFLNENTKLKNKLKSCSKSNPEEVPNEIDEASTVPLQKEFETFRDFVCGKLDVLFDALNGINDDSDTSSRSCSSPSPSLGVEDHHIEENTNLTRENSNIRMNESPQSSVIPSNNAYWLVEKHVTVPAIIEEHSNVPSKSSTFDDKWLFTTDRVERTCDDIEVVQLEEPGRTCHDDIEVVHDDIEVVQGWHASKDTGVKTMSNLDDSNCTWLSGRQTDTKTNNSKINNSKINSKNIITTSTCNTNWLVNSSSIHKTGQELKRDSNKWIAKNIVSTDNQKPGSDPLLGFVRTVQPDSHPSEEAWLIPNAAVKHSRSEEAWLVEKATGKDSESKEDVFTWEHASTGIPRKVMSSMGYSNGKGLGKYENGIKVPIEATPNNKKGQPRKLMCIMSDSMMNNIDPSRLTNNRNMDVELFCHGGCTLECAYSHLPDIVKKKPDYILLHIGTNNCGKDTSDTIINKIDKLKIHIQCQLPGCTTYYSLPIIRTDDHKASTILLNVNKKIRLSNYLFLDNFNIKKKHLGVKGLHLNARGVSLLAGNILSLVGSL